MSHNKGCVASAMSIAIRNLREDPEVSKDDFTDRLISGEVYAQATYWLDEGWVDCTCVDSY